MRETADTCSQSWPMSCLPLHYAVRIRSLGDDINPVKSILERDDSDINVGNVFGETPLHLVIRSTNPTVELIELLLRHGADVNIFNTKGETPLHSAVQNEKCSYNMIQLLLEHGADVEAKSPLDGNTALHWAAANSSTSSNKDYYYTSDYGIVDLLVKHGSDVNAGNLEGNTPLHLAVISKKEYPPISDLLHNGSDVDAPNFNRDSPLRLCLREGGSNTLIIYLRRLLNKTREINAIDSKGETLLHAAVRNKACAKVTFIKMLLDHGVNVGKRNAKGKNAYQVYCSAVTKYRRRRLDPMLEILLQSKEREYANSSLHVACMLHRVDSVRELLRTGADINDRGDFGHPPLFYALIAAPIDVDKLADKFSTVKLLLQCGADVNHKLFRPDVPMSTYRCWENDYNTSLLNLLFLGRSVGWARKLRDIINPITVEHMAKLLTLHEDQVKRGRNVKVLSKYNLRMINSLPSVSICLRLSCIEELKEMNKTKVGEISFLDFLLASAEETEIYANNKELVEALRTKSASFPMYQGMLETKLIAISGLERRKQVSNTQSLFSKILMLFKSEPSFNERNKRNKISVLLPCFGSNSSITRNSI